ncbi:MAG: hypothetical protein NTW86_15480 [Candidatus Sumerlaeota bacterium]|nr:hypothetical protein [Candidatus Sumerlaeota bacterium]
MSAPLRVCLISKYLYPHDTRLRQQALALGEMGSEVDIICLRGDGQPPVERRGRVTAYRVMRPTPKDSMARYLLGALIAWRNSALF